MGLNLLETGMQPIALYLDNCVLVPENPLLHSI